MILEHLQKRLNSKQAHVEFEFPFFMEKRAPITGAIGLMDYTVKLTATAAHEDRDFVVTVIVPVTTLCPCSKAISRFGAQAMASAGRRPGSDFVRVSIWSETYNRSNALIQFVS